METPKAIGPLCDLEESQIKKEFNVLDGLCKNVEDGKEIIYGFGELNESEYRCPYAETAVILNIYNEYGIKVDQKRREMIEDINDQTYINANYIKSCL